MTKTGKSLRKGLACLFALVLSVAFAPGLGVRPAGASAAEVAGSEDSGQVPGWGTIALEGLDDVTAGDDQDGEDYPFTVSLNDADDGFYLTGCSFSEWYLPWTFDPVVRSGEYGDGYLSAAHLSPGWKTMTVYEKGGSSGERAVYLDVAVKPSEVTGITAANFRATYKKISITAGSGTGIGEVVNGPFIRVQQLLHGTWTTVNTLPTGTSSASLGNLEVNSTYRYRLVGFVPADGDKPELIAPASGTIVVKTGLGTAPQVKSVKVSGASQEKCLVKVKSGTWPYRAFNTRYVTTYKVKVELKKKIPGTLGLLVNDVKVKGSGKTFTARVTEMGKLKGKTGSFKIASYRDSASIGSSKTVTKKAKIE